MKWINSFSLFLNIVLIPVYAVILIFYGGILLLYLVNLLTYYALNTLYKIPLIKRIAHSIHSVLILLARQIVKNERDSFFLVFMFTLSPLLIGSIIWQLMLPEFSWQLAVLHYIVLFGPKFNSYFYTFACKHREAHCLKGFYKEPYNRLFGRFFEWFLGLFYGNIPELERCAHLGIHHAENNHYPDLQSTLLYDRSKLSHFLRYVLSIYWLTSGVGPLVYFYKNKNWNLFQKMALGVVFFYSLMGIMLGINWLFCLVYFVLPYLTNNAIIASFNWVWHGFCDPNDPTNYYTGTITIVDSKNDILNEGYHLSHHINPSLHWTQNSVHYHTNQNLYKEKKATIFRELEIIEVFLLTTVFRRFDLLANKYIDLTNELSHEEIIELLKQRTRPINSEFKQNNQALVQ